MTASARFTIDADDRTRRGFASADRNMQGMARSAKRLASSLGVAFSVAGIAAFAKSSIAAADAIGKAAKVAGIAASNLQELRFAFGQLAGTTDKEVDESIRRFNRRLGLATQGMGEAKQTFEQMRVQFRNSAGELRSTDEVLEEVIGKLAAIASDSVRAARASQVFGEDAGPRLAAALGQGIDAMEALRDATPGVLSDEQVRKAEELTDEFDKMARTVGGKLKGAFVDATYALSDMFGLMRSGDEMTQLKREIADFTKQLDEIPNTPGNRNIRAGLEQRREQVQALLDALKAELDAAKLAKLSEGVILPEILGPGAVPAARQAARDVVRAIADGLADLKGDTVLELINPDTFAANGVARGKAAGQVRAQARAIAGELTLLSEDVNKQFSSLGGTLGDGLLDAFEGVFLRIDTSFGELIRRMLIRAAATRLFSGLAGAAGPVGAAFSFLGFGGSRQSGGGVTGGKVYKTHAGETYIPENGRIAAAGSMGGGVVINQHVQIDARGADPSVEGRLRGVLEAYKAQTKAEIRDEISRRRF